MSGSTDPEDIFIIQERIGEGSYGSVFKAQHKSTKRIVAIKVIPVDADLNDLMKEISILKSCKSDYVVRYYGSYYKDNDLWIVMEYCGGGSLSDLMMKGKNPLKEDEIRYVISEVLMGMGYLHDQKKIHRDIKSGNILLTDNGVAKLADFGVSVQLDSTISKRKTVIGTPFWMAPEVIQETSYNTQADVWSLGITAIELAEGVPPYSNIHPMRAIFMIPNRPPPRLQNESKWSKEFQDFISKCLTKDPNVRPTVRQLLEHPFVAATVEKLRRTRGNSATMKNMVSRLKELKRKSKKAEKAEKAGKIEKAVKENEKYNVNETLIQVEREEIDVQKNRTPVSVSDLSSVPVSLSDAVDNSAQMKPPARTVLSTVPATSISSSHAASGQRPMPAVTNQQPPPRPLSVRSPAMSPTRAGGVANSSMHQSRRNVGIVDSVCNTCLPEIPSQRPSNNNNLTEFIKLQHKGKDIAAQFKVDFQLLLSGYTEQLNMVVNQINGIL